MVLDSVIEPVFISREPFEAERIGAAAVYCSDGRFGEQMDEFLHVGLGLPRYDRVAAPGGAGSLAGHMMVYHEKIAMEQQLAFLIEGHDLNRIVLIAHEGCAFYKTLWIHDRSVEDQQRADLHKAAELLMWRFPKLEVDCYFARRYNGRVAFERWPIHGEPTTSSESHSEIAVAGGGFRGRHATAR